jgi:hypothetical protein
MKFSIVLKVDVKVQKKAQLAHAFGDVIKEYLRDRDYGEDVKDYMLLMIIYERSSPLTRLNKPTYVDHKVKTNRFTGLPVEMNKLLLNEVLLTGADYASFIAADDEGSKKIMAKMVLASLSNLENLPKKVKDFDKAKFKRDLEDLFLRTP